MSEMTAGHGASPRLGENRELVGCVKESGGREVSFVDSMTSVDVSVIIPVYNSAQWLDECLLGVLRQSRVTTQIICINDGSSDNSLRMLREYEAAQPHRIRVIDQVNGGLSVARNSGLNVATGRYVCMLDSDDYWRTDALACLVSRADAGELDVLQFDAIPFPDEGVHPADWKRYANYYKRPGQPVGILSGPELMARQYATSDYKPNAALYLVRRGMLVDKGLEFVPGIMHEDNPFTFAVLLNARRAAHAALDFHARRVRSGSIMTSSSIERSMRGYFVSYLCMREELSRHALNHDVAETINAALKKMLNNVSDSLSKLDDSAAVRLAELVSTTNAEQAYSELLRARSEG